MNKKPAKVQIHLDAPAEPNKTEAASSLSKKRQSLGWGHWMVYTRGAEYQALKPSERPITEAELAKHKQDNDMWMALMHRGQLCVFDITKFADYHPGGFDALKTCAGRDGTLDFRVAHAYVNPAMIERMQVGVLVKSSTPSSSSQFLSPHSGFAVPQKIPSRNKSKAASHNPKWDWKISEQDSRLLLSIDYDTDSHITEESATAAMLLKSQLIMHTFVKWGIYHIFHLNVTLPGTLKLEHYRSNDSAVEVQLNLSQVPPAKAASVGAVSKDALIDADDTVSDLPYFSAQLKTKATINHDCHLFSFELPAACRLHPPPGHHIFLRTSLEDVTNSRPYTPVLFPFPADQWDLQENCIHFVIKLYPVGFMSAVLAKLNVGDKMELSFPTGEFHMNALQNHSSIIMLAAGSGITVMMPILQKLLPDSKAQQSLLLCTFNKKKQDRIFGAEFKSLVDRFPNKFAYHEVLSEPDSSWQGGYSGRITADLLTELVGNREKPYFLYCGPRPFNNTCKELLELLNWKHSYGFSG